MKIFRPLWSEGVLLSPQQFQQQAEWESFRSAGISALASPFPWGVEQVEFNDSLLSSGLIQITQLRLWLEDGTLIDAQRSDLPPAPRELDAGQLADRDAVTVVIALPHMQPGVANVEQEGVSADRPVRYREEWVTLQDAFGSEEEPIAVARFNFTIRFAHENNDSWKVCPVARLIRDGHNPVWRQDHDPGKKSAYCLPDERAPPTPVQVDGKENVRIPSVHWRGSSAHSATRKGKHQRQQNRRVFRYFHDASPSDAGVGSVTDD